MSDSQEVYETQQIDYTLPKMGRLRYIIFSVAIFLLGFSLYYPLMNTVNSKIRAQLNHIPGCAIDYNDTKIELFFPKFIISDIVLPKTCFGQHGTPIKISKLNLNFRGLSFSPFGPHFKVETTIFDTFLESYVTIGLNEIVLNQKESLINLQKLEPVIPGLKFFGNLSLDAIVKIKGQQLNAFKLNIRSKDLTLPGQNIRGFKLQTINLNNLLLKVQLNESSKNKKIEIQDFILGDDEADIRANFKGHINLNQQRILSSSLDFPGEVAFSNDFLQKNAIVKLFMNQFNKRDQFYQIKITGTLARPIPKPL